MRSIQIGVKIKTRIIRQLVVEHKNGLIMFE